MQARPFDYVKPRTDGETGTIAASQAYVNAMCDMVGVDHIDMPITPEKVWRLLQRK